jgi:HK97 gp10 family phage protein
MKLGVQVIGDDVTIAKLAALARTSEIAVDAGTEAGAEAILQTAEGLVPVATGRLRDSLAVAEVDGEAAVGTDVEYAVFVEYGTADAGAQPFLRPAADAGAATVERAIQVALEAAIRAVSA